MFVNLTPHDVHVHRADGATFTIPRSGSIARVASLPVEVATADGIPIRETRYGTVDGVPDPVPGVFFVASMLVVLAVKRPDVVAPDDVGRDGEGKIIGCRAFARAPA